MEYAEKNIIILFIILIINISNYTIMFLNESFFF